SDHWPISYELDLSAPKAKSNRFNQKKMDLDTFISLLRRELELPITSILNQGDLDEATELLCNALVVALEGSTPRRRPSPHSKKWWRQELDGLLATLRR
ncbi:hypothetical protein C8R47DRAFT_958214, partial [Mycena vitilis]